MLCQYCNCNKADYRFFVNFNGQVSDVHLCAECTGRLSAQFQEFYNHMKPFMGGWRPERQEEATSFGEFGVVPGETGKRPRHNPFPTVADEDFSQRRKLGELRAQLQKAIQAEEYETAAKLRDEILRTENKVRT